MTKSILRFMLRMILVCAVANASLLPQAAQSNSHGLGGVHSEAAEDHAPPAAFEMGRMAFAGPVQPINFPEPNSHDHNPADHSHDIPMSLEIVVTSLALSDPGPPIRIKDLHFPDLSPQLDHPPRL